MKITHLLIFAATLAPALSFAQRGGYGRNQYQYNNMQYDNSVLSIFSENGEAFFLVLNGVKQNMAPQAKIRVEGLPKFRNDVQIMFADRRMPPIRQIVDISDPINHRAVNLTLRISQGRGGPRLKFHRMTECDRNYHGPRDEYVMYYGKPQQTNTVTETTYMDPVTGQWVTETTTTTTDNYGGNNGRNGRYNNHRGNYDDPPPPPAVPSPMDMRTFNDVKQSISSASFEDTKLSTAQTILNSNWVTTSQVMELCKLFSFENTKVKFAKFAYNRTVDPQNYYKVASVFDFDSNKRELNNFINSQAR